MSMSEPPLEPGWYLICYARGPGRPTLDQVVWASYRLQSTQTQSVHGPYSTQQALESWRSMVLQTWLGMLERVSDREEIPHD
jgi:hypothetical protein